MLLGVGEALEKVLPQQPPPPQVPACHGCKTRVGLRNPSGDLDVAAVEGRAAAHLAAQEASYYSFEVEGKCRHLVQDASKTEL